MCVVFKLDSTQATIDKFNWFLSNGYTVVDRFEFSTYSIIMVKKA